MLITDVSSRLGEFMLKGWVLTDIPCTTKGCKVPLMRSPNGVTPVVHFCANCQENPESSRSQSETSSSSALSRSRPSTPPTELSSEPSSPTFDLPPETPESVRRREQSDRASAEIGNRLLKGWVMLAEECPNNQCFGVPLVRPPKPGGEKDTRKECVICGGVYTTECDRAGRERLVPVSTEDLLEVTPHPETSNLRTTLSAEIDVAKRETVVFTPSVFPNATSMKDSHAGSQVTSSSTLDVCATSLENTLLSLSHRLDSLSNPSLGVIIDPLSISSLAESISKTTQALTHVKELQWKETGMTMRNTASLNNRS
ncbi:hypothetical protein E1B28_004442 [Marasmius oreades]|uniref:Uncharacterized protein n=1 Tax=Marasmius oreades TaxID=181124 RepID=A0A9P7UYP8_9AGAR|nr:uncharacterized protein E1B28_004442 [Marasmius oreades]KAG7097051.1 hypothetical protein E1B28_004442 [Marasmius oreades]